MSLCVLSNYEMENNGKQMRLLLISQNMILFGSGMIFPYYVIFIKEVGANFTQFGFAYALFAISSALVHNLAGRSIDHFGSSPFLAISAWGTACTLLFFPVVTAIYQVYILQIIMGLFGAFQKTAEKTLIADVTDFNARGKQIGRYHSWTTMCSGLAVLVAGYAIDLFTIDIVFYVASFFMFVSGFFCA